MKLIERHRRLSVWNKIAFWGAVASILGLFFSVGVSIFASLSGVSNNKVMSKSEKLAYAWINNFVRIDSPSFGQVYDSVYMDYNKYSKEGIRTVPYFSEAKFVFEDVLWENDSFIMRFTIYNNSEEKIKIYDVKTVEYFKSQHRFFYGGNRYSLTITPNNPFINQDNTIEIEARDNRSFRLKYEFKTYGELMEVIVGVLVYYHSPLGERKQVKSDKLLRIVPEEERLCAFNEDQIKEMAKKIAEGADPSQHDLIESQEAGILLNAWEKHQNL